MADTFDAGKWGMGFALSFAVSNATASQTDVDLTTPSTAAYAVMPAAGSVIALSVMPSANVTAGSIVFKVHKASTEYGEPSPVVTLNETNATCGYDTCENGAIRFAANDRIGVSYTSDATLAPTNTDDFQAILWVSLDANP